jgi:hypothetical protein
VVEKTPPNQKPEPFEQRRAENPEYLDPCQSSPKWRSHFILAAQRTKSDALLDPDISSCRANTKTSGNSDREWPRDNPSRKDLRKLTAAI